MNKIFNSGLRRHRPKKKFRFEYIRGKYSRMNSREWFWRRFDEMEKEEDGIKRMWEILKGYWEKENQ
ncbi:MAG: hypothetical protein ACR2N3_13960 [Pyrinomonadaceae bacterium]